MKYKNINLISVLILIFGFFSCKSTNLPVDSVEPFALLSKDSSIYVSVPVSNHNFPIELQTVQYQKVY
jgi:hypothetical protein